MVSAVLTVGVLAGCASGGGSAQPSTGWASESLPATVASPASSQAPVPYCVALAAAQALPDPEASQAGADVAAQRADYAAALNRASDAAQAAGRQEVAVFLALAAKVRADPAVASASELVRLQELTPSAQATIDADCPPAR